MPAAIGLRGCLTFRDHNIVLAVSNPDPELRGKEIHVQGFCIAAGGTEDTVHVVNAGIEANPGFDGERTGEFKLTKKP